MSGNTERFSGRVEEYARFRSGYPAGELLGFLREMCGLEPEWRVADVGAGTGLLTEVFLVNGNAVAAVEPNAAMRAVCEGLRARWPGLRVEDGTAEGMGLPDGSVELVAAGRAFHWFEPEGAMRAVCEGLRARWPGLRVEDGTAEGMGLPDGSVELVAAGRAFHWFEPEAAMREFRRVLVPGGWVALVASGPKRNVSEQERELVEIQRRYETRPGYVGSRVARKETMLAFLRELGGGVSPREAEFVRERRVGWEAFAGFMASLSCTPLEGEAGYPAMQGELKEFFARWSTEGTLTMPELCWISVAQVVPERVAG